MAREPQGGLTEYIQHHLHHNTVSLGDSAFMKIHLDSLVVSFVLGALFCLWFWLKARKAALDVTGLARVDLSLPDAPDAETARSRLYQQIEMIEEPLGPQFERVS